MRNFFSFIFILSWYFCAESVFNAPHKTRIRYCNIDYDREIAIVAELAEDERRKNETYIGFFMGHHVAEQKRVYVSKTPDGWRKTYAEYERFLTPKSF